MDFNEVHSGVQKNRKRKRIGRGPGSGHGKTSGRGHKGAKSRAGYSRNPIFQGGTMPLVRRVPKRGFFNQFAPTVVAINVADLEREFAAGEEVTPDTLRAKGLAKRRYDELKVLGTGDLTKKLTVSAHRFSESAKQKIEAAGGSCVIIPGKTPVEEKKKAAREAKK
ncbi:50S ribosomal protein L15 [Blastopirellula sp. JC732]|uniref:Large ribosomal subunit protein uL15 n=1 Tax=Blastopirellula sediminis TaxID=2894196 RepID=A0A9X1SFH6_9BACT|nr:50S ribosomal protein L15 [Blastopirellula sediminis]MCC9607507.1 50S ribosomal protein L15 [Blastopirellula sediminis]MCC9629200.1 50S ribosomal protein L15 [Blastopirellula sediminis]